MRSATIPLATCFFASVTWVTSVALADSAEPSLEVPKSRSSQSEDAVANPAATAVTPPALVSFVSAQYPEAALAEGLTAQVVLALSIDAQGQVVSATVEAPQGHGFDEAAVQAALGFKFQPALRAGRPLASKILYRYDFTLKEKPKTDEAPAVVVPATLAGRVQMGESRAALAQARVTITTSDGSTVTTDTDADGRWHLSNLPPGLLKVRVESTGFDPWTGTETLQSGEQLDLVYRLYPPAEGLEVTVRGERQDREVTRRTIEREQLALVPGTGGDALRAVQTMPGVARSPGLSGLIITRGSGPNGTQFFVDGGFTPQIYHFGGLTSVIPTEMIEAIDFYPGNFSAKYGRVAGGIIDVRLREMQSDGKYHGLAQVDLIDGRLLLRGPVPLAKGWNFVIAGRRSHVDAWLTPLLEGSVGIRTAPVYYDWQGFVENRPTKKSYVRFGAFGFDDRLSMVLKDSGSQDPGFGNSFTNSTGVLHFQGLYRHELSDKLNVSATAVVGRDRENMSFGAMRIAQKYIPITLRGELSYKIRDNLTLRAGPDIIYYHVNADIRATQPPREGQPDPGPYSVQPLLNLKDTIELFSPAVYAEMEWMPTRRIKVLMGNRLDYYNMVGRANYSPRLNARYDLVQGEHRTTVKAAAGRFYEYPEPVQLVDVFGTPGLRPNRAEHYSVGFEQEFTKSLDLSVEGFYKNLADWSVAVAKADGSTGYANIGTGRVIGLETLLRWKPTDRFFGWVSYTLSRSTRKDGPTEAIRLFEFDQTHILTVLGSYKLGRGWQVGARFRYVTGNPYTPCTGGILQAGAGTYSCRSGELYSQRTPAFNQLDVRVDKTWTFRDWKLTSYLDLQNAYNRSNPEAVMYNFNYTKPEYQTGLPIIPSLGLRGEF